MNAISTFKVKKHDREGWGSLALVTAGLLLCIPALMVGGILSEGLSLGGIVFCVTVGGLILWICACFVGIRSCDLGLPSTLISADGFGVLGARFIPALLITITSAGWFGVQTAVCGESLSVMAAEAVGFSIPAWCITLFWSAVMIVSSIYGYQIWKYLNHIMAPVLLVVLVYTVVRTVFFSETGSAAAFLLARRPAESMSYSKGITITVGAWAMGAFIAGDYCRYMKRRRDVVLGLSVGLFPVILAVFLSGAVFRILRGSPDITVILNDEGFPAMALIFLIFASWTTNMINMYCGGIAVSVLLGFGEDRLKASAALIGILGAIPGVLGISSRLPEFLSLLSFLVPPLIGVHIAVNIARFMGRRAAGKYDDKKLIPSKPIGGGGGGIYHESGVSYSRDHRIRLGGAGRLAYREGNSFFYSAS
ncbi:MAG: cytosine permease [Treponema sp.]|jgi:cytosine permease|nr:cytosine permease [Treponema sp.]